MNNRNMPIADKGKRAVKIITSTTVAARINISVSIVVI